MKTCNLDISCLADTGTWGSSLTGGNKVYPLTLAALAKTKKKKNKQIRLPQVTSSSNPTPLKQRLRTQHSNTSLQKNGLQEKSLLY